MAEPVTFATNGKLHKLAMVADGEARLDELFEAWGKIYGAFIRRRFVRASRGDGTWAPLSPATIARRRKGKGKGTVAILRDTGLLFQQLAPGFEASMEISKSGRAAFTASVDFGGTSSYPDGVTVSDVMEFHQTGAGNLPVRKIIVAPDTQTKQKMAEAGKRILADYLNG